MMMRIEAGDVILLNITYIYNCPHRLRTYGTSGCSLRFYADPYKTLK